MLIPDFRGQPDLLKVIADAAPDVIAHNIETVERLTPRVRDPRATYAQSLAVLAELKRLDGERLTKSSVMLGHGEAELELLQTMSDLRGVGVMKYVPGRKSDVQDCQWLQRLMSQGYLRAAFRPGDEVCVVRAVARQRDVLIASQASWVQRMQKALVQMNIQLTEVLTDVMGTTGQAIIRAIVAGERDAKALARHRHSRVKASEQDIAKALTGNWRDEHLFVLRQALAMYDAGIYASATPSCKACSARWVRPRLTWAAPRARAARAGRSSTRARFWPTGPASISRASTAWGSRQ